MEVFSQRLPARFNTLEPLLSGSPSVVWSLDDVPRLSKSLGSTSVFLVLAGHAQCEPVINSVLSRIRAACPVHAFTDVEPNPSPGTAFRAIESARRVHADLVLVIGGGSCIDVGKLVAVGIHGSRAGVLDFETQTGGLPMIVVPTTAGSGAEATPFAAIYDDGCKRSIAHPAMMPMHAVLDSRLLHTMPAPIAAASGLDAICQAGEALWAVDATDDSRDLARAAGPLAVRSIVEAVVEESTSALEGLQVAAHLAGRSIAISKTTASHALSYSITMNHGVSHGHAVALTFGALLKANAHVAADDCNHPEGPEFVRALALEVASWFCAAPGDVGANIRDLIGSLGLASSIEELGIGGDSLRGIAESVDPLRLSNNPRRLDVNALLRILHAS